MSLGELEAIVATADGAVVAFSGGVDSSLVAAIAQRVLGDRALAVTAVSPALADGELDGARSVAGAIGIAHRVVRTDELAREGYRRNGRIAATTARPSCTRRSRRSRRPRRIPALFSGANADDVGDWRPGLKAAAEHGVRHPLLEAGMGKDDVRALARELRIPSADKPASPCLASRIPYGTAVEPATLARIDAAEHALRALGYRELRVRHFGGTGRVELAAEDLLRASTPAERDAIVRAVLSAGYDDAQIDPEPFRSGSLNRVRTPLPLIAT